MLAVGRRGRRRDRPRPERLLRRRHRRVAQRLPLLLAALVGRSDGARPRARHRAGAANAPAATIAAAQRRRRRTARPQPRGRRRDHRPRAPPRKRLRRQQRSAQEPSEARRPSKLPPVTERVADPARRHAASRKRSRQPARRPLHRHPADPGRHAAERLVGARGQRLRERGGAGRTAATGRRRSLLHSIVQPPCPEGAAGASCAPARRAQLTAADEFLKADARARSPATAAYREHGLIVVTFATVGVAAPAGCRRAPRRATLTSQPPAGVLLISPFVDGGHALDARPSTRLHPRQSLEALLH